MSEAATIKAATGSKARSDVWFLWYMAPRTSPLRYPWDQSRKAFVYWDTQGGGPACNLNVWWGMANFQHLSLYRWNTGLPLGAMPYDDARWPRLRLFASKLGVLTDGRMPVSTSRHNSGRRHPRAGPR